MNTAMLRSGGLGLKSIRCLSFLRITPSENPFFGFSFFLCSIKNPLNHFEVLSVNSITTQKNQNISEEYFVRKNGRLFSTVFYIS